MKEAEMIDKLIHNLSDLIPGSEGQHLLSYTLSSDADRRVFLSNRLRGFTKVGACQ